MIFKEEDMLMMSGIQHFMFCPRQWALIHIDQQWHDNHLTTAGHILHKHVDDPYYRCKNGSTITLRSVSLASKSLGLYGISDAIELIPTDEQTNAIIHPRYPGYYVPLVVEYKKGSSKISDCDRVQLAAQMMALEEMYGIQISHGALFYGETRRRELVDLTPRLRQEVKKLAMSMHAYYHSESFPPAVSKRMCKSCSLSDICMPEWSKCSTVAHYLKKNIYEETT